MDPYLMAYILLILIYRFAESWAIGTSESLERRQVPTWTAALILVPYWLVILGSAFEHFTFDYPPSLLAALLGALFFTEATLVCVRAHRDVAEESGARFERDELGRLVAVGLYRHIRHPLYLANVFLFIACPVFLSVRFAWVATLLGIGGIVARTNLEERFLLKEMPGYEEYVKQTARLIPKIW